MRGDERRVVTVLFADLVGYTAMSESRDPEQVKNLVDTRFERLVSDIDAFGGRVDKIIGDAIVALFGAPVAHEDDAERAVRASLRMQETLAAASRELGISVRMRVGVNTGEVLVGALRAGGDYTAMGDVVNTASRMQTAAAPGTVLVGVATHAATRRVVRYETLEPIEVKGRAELVPVFRALDALAPPGYRPERNRATLVGREPELGMLSHAVDNVVRNSRAALLLVLGEAGLDKSRLAEELASSAAGRHDALVLEGRCVPYGEANVWWPVAEALRHGCGIHSNDPAGRAVELALSAVRFGLGDEASDDEIERVHQGLLYLMGYHSDLLGIDATRAREEATAALVTYAERSSAHGPVVVVLSDLHWADDMVLELIDALLDRLANRRFVVLATARQSIDERWHPPHGRHNLAVLTLDPLTPDSAEELLTELAGVDLGPELVGALLARSGGNPFFLEELVTLLADAGMVGAGSNGRAAVADLIELPDTLRGLVAARLDGLTGRAKALASQRQIAPARADVSAALEDQRGVAWAHQNLAWCAFYSGHAEEAEGRLRQAAATFEEIGDRGGLAWATGLLAWTRFQLGFAVEAGEMAESLLDDARAGWDRWGFGMMRGHRGGQRARDGPRSAPVAVRRRRRRGRCAARHGRPHGSCDRSEPHLGAGAGARARGERLGR